MFGHKRRAASNPAFNHGPKPSASAATAAAQAFLKNQASSASLSAAAAATALRSRPTTPVSVADVQTKRMLRRTTSNSSYGSNGSESVRGPPGSQLERRGSAGSMTERTFREPSPNRGSARPSVEYDVPPVPAIPKNLPSGTSHRRTASMETPATRVTSPPPNMANGRGSSLGPTPSAGLQQQRRPPGQRMSNLSSVQELTGADRQASRGSVNFSYPTSNRAMSPYGQRQLTKSQSQNQVFQKPNLVYDPNTRSFRPEAELLFLEQSIHDVANRPAKKKKKAVATQPLAGSHLADGTAGGRIKGTAVDAMESNTVPEAPQPEPIPTQAAPAPRRKKKAPISQQFSEVDAYASTGTSDGDSESSERPRQFNTRAGMLLSKKPSIVREDREREEVEEDTSKVLGRQAALTRLESPEARTVSPTPRRAAPGRGHGRGPASESVDFAQSPQQTRSASLPAHGLAGAPTTTADYSDVKNREIENLRPNRVQSVSPVRTAHFMHSPESLAVRHDPPPRAVSPRKSALKHSSASPRGGSPAPEHLGRGQGATPGDVSDTSTALSDIQPAPKKKSVRVSFDDENSVVVGQAAGQTQSDSPIVQSPQTKRGWLSSLGRGKKKDNSGFDDADDEIMKPRPALPSFGSVREKKVRDTEDRPLVKPAEPVQVNPSPPLLASHPGEQTESIGQSSDHIVGAVFAQDQASKNAANISKSREPLPPEVTSVEGSGYVSDSSSSTYSLNADPSAIERSNSVKRGPVDGNVETYRALASSEPELHGEPAIPAEKTNGNGSVPAPQITDTTLIPEHTLPVIDTAPLPETAASIIETTPTIDHDVPTVAITSATPTVEQTETMTAWPHIPGGFPEGSSDSGHEDSQISLVEHKPTDLTPAAVGIAEPAPIHHEIGEPVVGEIAAQNLHHIAEETEESDRDSIYSDAAEDLSDFEGDGFMSLDAVVESPITPSAPMTFGGSPPASPTSKAFKEKAYKKSQLSRKSSEPELDEGWDKAQLYWSGLTADKKRQLELDAMRDNEESSEEEETEPTPAPKPKKKVSLQAPVESEQPERAPRQAPVHNRTYQIANGAKAGPDGMPATLRNIHQQAPEEEHHMRKSMRSGGAGGLMRSAPQAPHQEGHMRSSMRNGPAGGGSMRGSMRGSSEPSAPLQPKASLQKKYRPMSYQAPEVKPDPAEVKKHMRNMSAGAAFAAQTARPAATLRRTDSVDSDVSDSSFKRARPSTDGYNMKRSMRGSTPATAQGRPQSPEISTSKNRSSRFSLRSLSPTGSAFRKNSTSSPAPPVSMPTTMRGNRPAAPTLRAAPPQQKNAPPARSTGFGRSKPAPTPTRAPQRASRFNDSSDDEDVTPAFRSRFVDSSDEEDVALPATTSRRMGSTMRAGNAPVRALPRQTGANDGDSSDLPDTDDEKDEEKRKAKRGKPVVNILIPPQTPSQSHEQGTGGGSALASGSLRRSGSGRGAMGLSPTTATTTTIIGGSGRPEQKRRGSFMSILRRKKDPGSKVRKSDAESPARRDTPLERSRSEVMAVKRGVTRQDSSLSVTSGVGSPGGGKLVKRGTGTPKRMLSGEAVTGGAEWPLSSPISPATGGINEKDEEARPGTADASTLLTSGTTLTGGNAASIAGRPDLGSRRATATGLSAIDGAAGKRGKKKRFGMLRRAFGLDD